MALNIPMPGFAGDELLKGITTGSNMFSKMMQPILEREKQKQLEAHFQEQLKLSKAAAGRAALAASDAHKKMDPMYQINQYKALEDWVRGQSANGQNQGMAAQSAPTQEIGEGLGAFTPEGMQEAQEAPAVTTASGAPTNDGLDMELLKQHPMLRGFAKKFLGFDPMSAVPQTPEEKEAMALDLFRKKEEYKSQQEPKQPAAIKALHENIIQLSPRAVKTIQHIIDIPSPKEPWGTGALWADQKAAHHKAVTSAAESYSKAKGWPNTKGSIEKAESILKRGEYETDNSYRDRLRGYQDELNEGAALSNQFLHPNKQMPESQSYNDVIEYERVNGKLVPKKKVR